MGKRYFLMPDEKRHSQPLINYEMNIYAGGIHVEGLERSASTPYDKMQIPNGGGYTLLYYDNIERRVNDWTHSDNIDFIPTPYIFTNSNNRVMGRIFAVDDTQTIPSSFAFTNEIGAQNISGKWLINRIQTPTNKYDFSQYVNAKIVLGNTIIDIDEIAIIRGSSRNKVYFHKVGDVAENNLSAYTELTSDYIGGYIEFNERQEVSNYAYEVISNFAINGNNSYTIKDNDGNVLTSLSGAPEVKRIKLENVSTERVKVTLTGVDDVEYYMYYSHVIPEGDTFYGVAYTKDSLRANIGVGVDTYVRLRGDIVLYDVIQKAKPVDDSMTIELYRNSAELMRVDKTSFLTLVETLSGSLREGCNIVNPSIRLYVNDVPAFNYVHISKFNRYYFVTNVTNYRTGIWDITLRCDVLMSYIDGIKNLTAIIGRQENDYNEYLVDSEIPTQKNEIVTITEIPNTVLDVESDENVENFVLTVVTS